MLIRFFEKPARFEYMHKWLARPGVKILDVGCGNNSPTRTKRYYPKCLYYGLDIISHDDAGDKNLAAMEQFFEIDLSNISSLSKIPDLFFDCIILSHVVEHLENGTEVIAVLLQKLVVGGVIYVEFPSPKSVNFPSMRGSLNFYDDPSHVRVYQLEEISTVLSNNGFSITRAGTRRSLKRILFLPLYALVSLVYHGYVGGSVLWDFFGFADYLIAVKIQTGSDVSV
jgi:SAM-dependent methyltransferase